MMKMKGLSLSKTDADGLYLWTMLKASSAVIDVLYTVDKVKRFPPFIAKISSLMPLTNHLTAL